MLQCLTMFHTTKMLNDSAKLITDLLVIGAVVIGLLIPCAMSEILSSEVRSSQQLVCTSEREVCLPANYSKFQLPNKGKQTMVSIGTYRVGSATLVYHDKLFSIQILYYKFWAQTFEFLKFGAFYADFSH